MAPYPETASSINIFVDSTNAKENNTPPILSDIMIINWSLNPDE